MCKNEKTLKDFAVDGRSATKNDPNFVIEDNNDLIKEVVAEGPRIGLSDKYPDYLNRNYRFVIFKNKIKKKKRSLNDI